MKIFVNRWPLVVLRYNEAKKRLLFRMTFGFDWVKFSRYEGGERYQQAEQRVENLLSFFAKKLDACICLENQMQSDSVIDILFKKRLHRELLSAKKHFWRAWSLAGNCGFPDQHYNYRDYIAFKKK
jgi:hypothetical protein